MIEDGARYDVAERRGPRDVGCVQRHASAERAGHRHLPDAGMPLQDIAKLQRLEDRDDARADPVAAGLVARKPRSIYEGHA